jgi:predicted DCC family thiol-disulfide oxidoreductase YuxK
MPLYYLSILPILRKLFDAGYRAFADNRHRISRTCRLPGMPDVKVTSRANK